MRVPGARVLVALHDTSSELAVAEAINEALQITHFFNATAVN